MGEPKPSLLEQIEAAEDVAEELVHIPMWGVDILFRGMSFAALQVMQGGGSLSSMDTSTESGKEAQLEQAARLVAATACDPATKKNIFVGEYGINVLKSKGYEAVMHCINKGTNVVLGVDENETSGKDSSSTETESKTVPA